MACKNNNISQSEHMDLQKLDDDLLSCRKCLTAGYDIVPGAIFSHPEQAKVMLIGQAPGITEVEAKRPFNAGSGRRLFQWLEKANWIEDDFRSRNAMTAVTKCYPGKGKNGKGDRVPSKTEQKLCRTYLERELFYYDPLLLLLVGGLAIKLFFPARLRLNQIIGKAAFLENGTREDLLNFDIKQAQIIESPEEVSKVKRGRWIVPLPHPSGASLWPNKAENQLLIDRAMELLFQLREVYQL